MQGDFHYYATFCAAYLAGYTPAESLEICYSTQLTDLLSRALLVKLHAPLAAATTQLQLELMDARTDPVGLQNITRIWASFHFLPYDLYADPVKGGRLYKSKYQLICKPNGELVTDTVDLARGRSLQAVGLAMHVLADTWAHQNFAGTPSLAINAVNRHFYEFVGPAESPRRRKVEFRHSTSAPDDLEQGIFSKSLYQPSENSIMNLGHGRAGHLPDYSFARYAYLPAWADYDEVVKDNPSDYYRAFCQMVYAMRCLRSGEPFELRRYATDVVEPWRADIWQILTTRQLDASKDWLHLGERMTGTAIPAFDLERYQQEYLDAPKDSKDDTFLGRFILAALAQKSMVTNRIHRSGSLLAGFSIDYNDHGLKGMRDYFHLARHLAEEAIS